MAAKTRRFLIFFDIFLAPANHSVFRIELSKLLTISRQTVPITTRPELIRLPTLKVPRFALCYKLRGIGRFGY